ncbi:hypothetical protein, partial [uncultured Bifidobacterium sp.]|uniref:hypothetical protein n=1 Tax=uncultured Bifidobacterium sp. TaxID=165187 RepID=UPI0025DD99BF
RESTHHASAFGHSAAALAILLALSCTPALAGSPGNPDGAATAHYPGQTAGGDGSENPLQG